MCPCRDMTLSHIVVQVAPLPEDNVFFSFLFPIPLLTALHKVHWSFRRRGRWFWSAPHTYLSSIPKFPGLSRVFSFTPECYFINPEKSRNWLHSTFLYTHPDLLVTGERQTVDMCSPEQDVHNYVD